MNKEIDITALVNKEISTDDKTYQQFLTEGEYIVRPANDEIDMLIRENIESFLATLKR